MAEWTAAWAPFFDDVNAIIFLAPISCFDQVLAEDPSINRLVCDRMPLEVLLLTLDTGRLHQPLDICCFKSAVEEHCPRFIPQQV
jgi:hypothetical protein